MFSTIKFEWKLRKLQKERRTLHAEFMKALNAEEETSGQNTYEYYKQPLAEIQDAIGSLTTEYYREQAEQLMLPIPPQDDEKSWVESHFSHSYHLTLEGLSQLRTAVRKEKKERWERWQIGITLAIGLVGALIGLVSLWN